MELIDTPEDWGVPVRIVTRVTKSDLERFLTESEMADLAQLKVEDRRLERAASRIAGKLAIQSLSDIEDPRDVEFLKEGDRPFVTIRSAKAPHSVSFTHSNGLGAAVADKHPIGIDLEHLREITSPMTRFFLTSEQLMFAESVTIEHSLLHHWSAKEAAFKIGGFQTLLKTPLRLVEESSSGLTFELTGTSMRVRTRQLGEHFVLSLATAL